MHWADYNAAQQGREVRPLCREVMELAGPGAGRQAVDLGCGLGLETRALLRAGWRVHAVDGEPGTGDRVLTTTRGCDRSRLTVEVRRFADLAALPPADLVYAGYSLPFADPGDFGRLWAVVRGSLRPGGWFAANLFGDRDAWAGTMHGTFLALSEVRQHLDGLQIVELHEEDGPGSSYRGPKHWHAFHVIARRPETPFSDTSP